MKKLLCFIVLCCVFPSLGMAQEPPPPPIPPGAERPDGITTCSIPNPNKLGIYYELIVGKYARSESLAGLPPDCGCAYPHATMPDCYWHCLLEADYTRALLFENKNAEHSDGTHVWVLATGKEAEIRSLIKLLEKGATYRFCAYVPAKQPGFRGKLTFYRIHPYFGLTKISGGSHGE